MALLKSVPQLNLNRITPQLRVLHKSLNLHHQPQRLSSTQASEWERAKPLSQMPGFTKWQIFRAFLPGGKLHKKEFEEMLRLIQKEYGDMVYMPGVLGQPNRIMAYKPEIFEKMFRNEGPWPIRGGFETIRHHRSKLRKDYFRDVIGILASNGEQWGTFRSVVNPVLMQPKTVKNYIGAMSKVNEEFVQRIKDIRDPATLEVPENFEEEMNRWTMESVSVVALDKHLGLIRGDQRDNKEVMEFFQHIKKFLVLFTELEFAPPIWKIIPTSNFKQMMTALDGITDFVHKQVNEANERLINNKDVEKPDAEKSVLEKLLKIDPKVARVMALDMLFGGVESTTTAFAGILLCLSQWPKKQAKLREEILKILPNKSSAFTEENMKNLPYLRACLKESQRLYPFAAGVQRGAPKDIVLNGYRVPEGTDVSLINSFLLRDPDYFPQPDEFIPERWLRHSDKPEELTGKSSHPFAYFPFGFGPRICVGKRIVEMELEIGVARIIRNFHLEFNYPTDKVFKNVVINVPAKPLKFKFQDLQ